MDKTHGVVNVDGALFYQRLTRHETTVLITVRNGVAYVDYVPHGVIVRVVDYDVDPNFQTYSEYEVSENTIQR